MKKLLIFEKNVNILDMRWIRAYNKGMLDKGTLYSQIGEKVRSLRTSMSLNQEDLSKKVGMTRSSIAQIEAGKQAVSVYTLYRLGEALNKPIADILPLSLNQFDVYSENRLEKKEVVLNLLEQKIKGLRVI
ncbi:MAG: helix-turn-helix domain-containing protein [Bacteroidales bacterium]|nr:helix-turn-helix domain-containing protein [Bacteroidales bacterium]